MSKQHRPIQIQNRPPSNPQLTSQNTTLAAQFQFQHHQGPLPHPKILHEYDQVVPGAAERIICMAEDQAKHRQSLEGAVINSDIKDSRIGLFLGFIIGLVAIVLGTTCVIYGHDIAGGAIGGSAVPGLAAVFVYGSRQRRKEREEKQQTTKNKKS